MLCNVKCAARKIRITFCGKILCKSVKLAEPPDAEPHVRWCERSAAKAASYSIKNVKIKREYAIIKENHKPVRLHILTESAELFEFNIIQII